MTSLLVTNPPNLIDPEFTLVVPQRFEILPRQIRDKVWACLATRFNVQKAVVRTIVKLDKEITQYGKVRRSQGGDLMVGRHFVKISEDSRDASFVRVEFRLLSFCYAMSDHSSPVHPICRSACTPHEKNT